MKYAETITDEDESLIARLKGFVPEEVYDIHAHLYDSRHFPTNTWSFLSGLDRLGCEDHRQALLRYMPVRNLHGLYFGLPHRFGNRKAINESVVDETRCRGTELSRALMVVSPLDNQDEVAMALRSGTFCGIKVYHCYAGRPDTMQASITEYAPEWMWEILHEVGGVLMLHIVRDAAIADADNQRQLRMLSRAYPRARVVLAHVARSFNYRHARAGLPAIEDLDNVILDTSAICEAEAFRAALRIVGPQRLAWGSDFAVSEMRGRCVTTGAGFFWLHPEVIREGHVPTTKSAMTLVGIESLFALQEACEDEGLNTHDVKGIFFHNAKSVLKPHLPSEPVQSDDDGPILWKRALTMISGGTGLLSKRAVMYGTADWPSYFSKCSGCQVWDLRGRRYIDFAGGIGAVLLGYRDDDVTNAVRRRLNAGTYCSLVSPDEAVLAERLLALHPWAGKVRYARGGGEAMAVAVRVARSVTGKSGVLFCGYHGWHDWYLAANLAKEDALDGHLLPGLHPKGVPRELAGTAFPFRFNDLASFEKAMTFVGENLAAVVMEPMRSEEPRNSFLETIVTRCHNSGAVFIGDEITSGLRFGFPGAFARMNITPDIVVYAKAMSNGFPFAAIVGKQSVMDKADDSFISSSYWTDGVGTAAALAVLEKMQRLNIYDAVWQKGLKFREKLKALSESYPKCKFHVGGMPVSPSLTFQLGDASPAAKAVFNSRMLQRGFLVSSAVYLMYAHEDAHIEAFLSATQWVLAEMEEEISDGKVWDNARNGGMSTGFARLA